MRLNRLTIKNLRNISHADIALSPTLNFFYGQNGAGKTTVLEAVYLLVRSKSFRKGHPSTQIRHGADELLLFTDAESSRGERIRVGLQRRGNKLQMRLNGDPVRKLSDLALALPMAMITPQSHRILEEGPDYRHRLLNWGLFHVEHHYGSLLSSYTRVLMQRNHALRAHGSSGLEVWDKQLVKLSMQISRMQENYVAVWNGHLEKLTRSISLFPDLKLSSYPGWDQDTTLEILLRSKVESDRKQGFTSVGSHRADIQIHVGGLQAKNLLSRGQQKLLIFMLIFAQSLYMTQKIDDAPIFLIDDLQSELDPVSQGKVLSLLTTYRLQSLITGTSPSNVLTDSAIVGAKMFHVEHGELASKD